MTESEKQTKEIELEQKLAEQTFRKSVFRIGPDGCVYRAIDLSESAFDKRYGQR